MILILSRLGGPAYISELCLGSPGMRYRKNVSITSSLLYTPNRRYPIHAITSQAMDPLSITMAAIGITDAAVTGLSALRSKTHDLQDAPEDVNNVRTRLEEVQSSLQALKSASIADQATQTICTEVLRTTGVATAVNDCGSACEAFNKKLQSWTKHSTENGMSLRDRVAIARNKAKICTLLTRVETCQKTVHFAVSSTQL
jgi:hypothetical protein